MSAQTDDAKYFALRAQQVRALAEKAEDPAVRAIHAEFARLYARRARSSQGT